MADNQQMPGEKGPEVFYTEDGFKNDKGEFQTIWHYAVSDQAAIRAHKFHFFGNEGLQKKWKQEPKSTVAPTYFGTVCLEAQCCALSGVPYEMAQRLDRQRRSMSF